MSEIVEGPISSHSIRAELCRLAKIVQLDDFLSENSQEDDYLVVLEEVTSKIQRLSSSATDQARELENMKQSKRSKKDQEILDKSKRVEDELKSSLQQLAGRNEWYEKYMRLGGKIKRERAQNAVLEDFVQAQNKKIAVLVDHTEKLMKALRLENTKRVKLLDEMRKIQKEENKLREKIERQAKVNNAQQRAIKEVTEGSKVLEDQLCLMDEKYLELRSKLDNTREHLHKIIDKVKKECTELRKKYTVATGGGLLDKVKVQSSSGGRGGEGEGHRWPSHSLTFNNPGDNTGANTIGRPNSLDYAEVEAIRLRMNRSKSVDFSPVAVQTAPYNSNIRSPAQLQMQEAFMSEIKVGLPPHGVNSNNYHGTSSSSLPRPGAASSQRPGSAMPSPKRNSNNNSPPPQRPKTSGTNGRAAVSLPKAVSERLLSQVVRKIQRKDGGNKKLGWTADRLQELLEG